MQMNEKVSELKRKLYSDTEWKDVIDNLLYPHFISLGFHCPEDFMKIRVYDFLNLDMVDNNRAEEMIVALSDFLYPEREKHSEMMGKGTTEAILKWLEEHADLSKVLLRELICDDILCLEDMLYVFDCISMSFYHSNEYNSRKYHYSHIRDIKYSFCVATAESEERI